MANEPCENCRSFPRRACWRFCLMCLVNGVPNNVFYDPALACGLVGDAKKAAQPGKVFFATNLVQEIAKGPE